MFNVYDGMACLCMQFVGCLNACRIKCKTSCKQYYGNNYNKIIIIIKWLDDMAWKQIN